MPRLSILMIRTALAYLAIGALAGALLLAQEGVPIGSWITGLIPVHVEFLLLGWTVQLALGVAFWILPRFRSGAERGREKPAWLAFALLNIGVNMVALGSAVNAPDMVRLLGRCTEVCAAAAFSVHAWPRVKAYGSGR